MKRKHAKKYSFIKQRTFSSLFWTKKTKLSDLKLGFAKVSNLIYEWQILFLNVDMSQKCCSREDLSQTVQFSELISNTELRKFLVVNSNRQLNYGESTTHGS